MAKQQVEAFFEKMKSDKDLKDKVAAIKEDMDAVYTKMAKIAKDAGFDVTPEDIRDARVTMGAKGKLDDAEIDKIAGGCSSVCTSICGMHLGHWLGRQ